MPIEELARRLDVTRKPSAVTSTNCRKKPAASLSRRRHLSPSVENEEYSVRKVKHQAEKKARIGELVASHIPDDASLLFMNIGTTIEAVARALCNTHKHLRIVTNCINVATVLTRRQDFEIIITGGVVRHKDSGITGVATLDMIEQFRVDYAIVGASGVDLDGSLMDYDYREVRARRR